MRNHPLHHSSSAFARNLVAPGLVGLLVACGSSSSAVASHAEVVTNDVTPADAATDGAAEDSLDSVTASEMDAAPLGDAAADGALNDVSPADDALAVVDTGPQDIAPISDAIPVTDAIPADAVAGVPESWVSPDVADLPPAAVRGRVWIFGPPGGPLPGAKVTMLEHPELETVSDANGAFEFLNVPAGDVTLVMTAAGYHENQLGTHTVAGVDADHFDFQAVSDGIYNLFASLTEVDPDPAFCQVSTTVTRYFEGSLPGVHGEPGVVTNIEPALSAKHGPIYFSPEVLPTPGLTETSVDGGVVWMNVPPGDYVLHATKPGVTFEDVRIHCRPNVLVNAGPPRGLQGLNPGNGY